MFQNGQRVCFKNGGDPARIQRVQLAYGKDRSRAPQVIPTTDTNATQVQVVTGEDAARYPFIDPIGLIGAPAAWFRADTGVTVTGLGASTWADQSGNGRDLLQTTDASRPPYLSYSASSGKYLYLPGVAGNYASTPDSVAASITGDIDIRVKAALDDWTPAAINDFVFKGQTLAKISYGIQVVTTGHLRLSWSADGSTQVLAASTVVTGVSDGATKWVRATLDVNNGSGAYEVKFYLSDDGATWSQLGATVSPGGTTSIHDNDSIVEIGSALAGTDSPAKGKIYRAIIKNGIDGTTVVDFNPDRDGSDQAATITSSATGEVWTINKSGGLPAQIVARPSLLFDGSADYLKCNAFTLNQPETVYIAFKQVSWTSGDTIMDGEASRSLRVTQTPTTPSYAIDAGSVVGGDANLAVGSYGVLTAIFNGAASYTGINNVALAGPYNPGAANAGGFTLGAAGTPGGYANIQVLEVILAGAAHDSSTRARVIQYLSGRHGIAL